MEEWNLRSAFRFQMTDSAKNMMSMDQHHEEIDHIKCLNNVLQLCINDEILKGDLLMTEDFHWKSKL